MKYKNVIVMKNRLMALLLMSVILFASCGALVPSEGDVIYNENKKNVVDITFTCTEEFIPYFDGARGLEYILSEKLGCSEAVGISVDNTTPPSLREQKNRLQSKIDECVSDISSLRVGKAVEKEQVELDGNFDATLLYEDGSTHTVPLYYYEHNGDFWAIDGNDMSYISVMFYDMLSEDYSEPLPDDVDGEWDVTTLHVADERYDTNTNGVSLGGTVMFPVSADMPLNAETYVEFTRTDGSVLSIAPGDDEAPCQLIWEDGGQKHTFRCLVCAGMSEDKYGQCSVQYEAEKYIDGACNAVNAAARPERAPVFGDTPEEVARSYTESCYEVGMIKVLESHSTYSDYMIYDISDIKTSADGNRILYWGTVILKSDKPINDLIPITWSICDEDAASAAFPDVDPNRLRMESLGYLLERGDDGEWVAIAIDPTGGYFVGDFDISTYKK